MKKLLFVVFSLALMLTPLCAQSVTDMDGGAYWKSLSQEQKRGFATGFLYSLALSSYETSLRMNDPNAIFDSGSNQPIDLLVADIDREVEKGFFDGHPLYWGLAVFFEKTYSTLQNENSDERYRASKDLEAALRHALGNESGKLVGLAPTP